MGAAREEGMRMFDDERMAIDGVAGHDDAAHVGDAEQWDWRTVDRRMRRLAARRSALDAEEARLLVIARRLEIHRKLGYGSFDEYLERALGYAPTTGRDRVRVAEALEELPEIGRALEHGTIGFSAVREITRIATPETEAAWLAYVDGLTVREVEQAVRGRRRGDPPGKRPDPDLEPRILRIEVPPQTYALFREARRHLELQVGHAISDADFMAVASRALLGGRAVALDPASPTPAPDTPPPNLPPHQIAIVVCDECKRGWHDTPGRSVELSPAAIERAGCDAVEIGRVDDGETPPRKTWTISPRTRAAVLARDRQRCTVPGCTSSSFVDVHHIKHRAHGGDDRMSNLTCLCELHHQQHHDGVICISGTGGAIRVVHADGRPYGAAPPMATSSPRAPAAPRSSASAAAAPAADATAALVGLGYPRAEAAAFVARAAAHVGDAPSLEQLITAALREGGRART
jgi:hypothetical protein